MLDAGAKSSATSYTATFYLAPGVRYKPKKGTVLEFKYNNDVKTVVTGTKSLTGILILDGVFTLGIFTAIDPITGAGNKHDPRYIDVPAVMTDRTQRSQTELQIYMMQNSK